MSFDVAYRCIQRRRFREGLRMRAGSSCGPGRVCLRTRDHTELLSAVVSGLLLRMNGLSR